jgi:uncharacterized integral membrane protein
MPKPDLSTPEAKQAYRSELVAVGRPLRIAGLAIVGLAMAVLLYVRFHDQSVFQSPLGLTGLGAMAVGWTILIAAIAQRTVHHQRRMAED